MYGDKQTQAHCCECKELTLHKYVLFGQVRQEKKTQEPAKFGLFKTILSSLFESSYGDYKCTKCGTYLNTPDNLD
jgi:hypothetical protein